MAKFICAISVLLILFSVGYAQQDTVVAEYVAGQVLIKTTQTLTAAKTDGGALVTGVSWFDALSAKYSITELSSVFNTTDVRFQNYYKVAFDSSFDVKTVLEDFKTQSSVEIAEPNYIFRTSAMPDDARYNEQWALSKIQAPQAWDINTGNSSVIIGIVDTGCDIGFHPADPTDITPHPDLADNLWTDALGNYGYTSITGYEEVPPYDGFGHGTHVAGIVAASSNNNQGICGLAGGWGSTPGVKIMTVKGLNDLGYSQTDWLANAVYWAAEHGARVINMSWRTWAAEPGPVVLKDAIGFAHDECGCVLVAAAGNDYRALYPDTSIFHFKKVYPAFWDSCIAVGATLSTDVKALYSNYSVPVLQWVDVAAPGGGQSGNENSVMSTTPTYEDFMLRDSCGASINYEYMAGTSMAAPYVSGLAGLILSQWPGLTSQEVRERILGTVDNIVTNDPEMARANIIGTGRINAYKALTMNESPVYHYWDHCFTGSVSGVSAITAAPGFNSMVLSLRNIWKDALDNPVKLRTKDTVVVFTDSFSFYSPLEKYAVKDNASDPFTFSIMAGCSLGHEITFEIARGIRKDLSDEGGIDEYEYEVTDSFKVTVGPPMQQGWPVYLSGAVVSSPAGADLDGDGYPEIVVGSCSDTVYAIKRDGGFLWKYGTSGDVKSPPAIADLDGDGRFETVVGSSDGHLYAVGWDGALKWKYPNAGAIDSVVCAPVIEDLNGDGLYEVAFGDLGNNVYALNNKGILQWRQYLPAKIYSSPAVGDFDGDAVADIIVGCNSPTSSWLYCLKGVDGSIVWQKSWLGERGAIEYRIFASPNVADIDRDGDLEVVGCMNYFANAAEINAIFLLKNDGTEIGWKYISDMYADIVSKASTAIADVNCDDYLEIIGCAGAAVSVIDKDGGCLWSKMLSSNFSSSAFVSSPVSAGFTKDPEPQIFCNFYNSFSQKHENHVLGSNSSDIWQGPFASLTLAVESTPFVTSLNGGSRTDLIVGCNDGYLYAWSFDTPYNLALAEWPMFQHDIRRTGNYHAGRPLTSKRLDATAYNNGRKMVFDEQSLKNHLAYTSNDKIFYATSQDPLAGWDLPLYLGDGNYPAVALDEESKANVVWTNTTSDGAVQLCCRRIGETTYTVVKMLGENSFDNTINCSPPSVAVKDDTVHVVYLYSHTGGIPPDVLCTRLVMHAQWPLGKYAEYEEETIDSWQWNPLGPAPRSPSICIDSRGCVNLAWEKISNVEEPGEVWWTVRYPNGDWHVLKNISNSCGVSSREPSLYTYGNVHLVWEEGGEIFYGECVYQPTPLTDAAMTTPSQWDPYIWSAPINIGQTTGAVACQPVFADNHIAFMEQSSYDSDVMLYEKQDGVWQPVDDGNISKSPTQMSCYPHLGNYDGIFLNGVWTECDGWGNELKAFQKEVGITAVYQANVGDSIPSPYTAQRDGYIVYGDDAKSKMNIITVDYDTSELIYKVPGIRTDKKYTLDISLYQINAKSEKWQYTILVDDNPIQTLWVPSATQTRVTKLLPDIVAKDSVLEIHIVKKKGNIVTCDKWQLFEDGKGNGGSQNADVFPPHGFINALYQNAPNPYKQSTTINYQLAKPGPVSVKIYNTLGQLVKTLVDQHQIPGYYSVRWDGRDGAHRKAASGIYFYRLIAEGFCDTKKMVMLK